MFRFNPDDVPETKKTTILADGHAYFEIKDAKTKTTKKGDLGLNIKLWVTDATGKVGYVFDFIGSSKLQLWKLRSICEAIGHEELINEGAFDPSFLINKAGECMLITENDNVYGKRSKIRYYINGANKNALSTGIPSPSQFVDDDLPF